MLLLEEKSETSSICYFKSSNILAAKYDSEKMLLAVIFNDGWQYVYENISNYTFQRFKIAESQGQALNKHIKGKFNFMKVSEKLDVTELKKTVETLYKQ
jgi:hypothetical protein